jgi:nicotinamide-nucleotide amidase
MIFKNMLTLQEEFRKNKWTLTCAESCTGGLISSYITQVSGSSSIFRGSVITYCNEVKEQELNVQKQTMIDNGVVSIEVVNEMLEGVIKKFDADFAIAISGVAGPTGGTKNKPVGTVVIGIKGINNILNTKIYYLKGSRKAIQKQAADVAFTVLYDELQNLLAKDLTKK